VDTDAMHCLDEKDFVPEVSRRLEDYLGRRNVAFGVQYDLLYSSVLRLPLESEDAQQWQDLASGKKYLISSFEAIIGMIAFWK